MSKVGGLSLTSQGGPQDELNPVFCSMKQLRVLLLLPGWDASLLQGYPQQYVAGTHLVERDNVG